MRMLVLNSLQHLTMKYSMHLIIDYHIIIEGPFQMLEQVPLTVIRNIDKPKWMIT